ncbi:VOC family protein [Schaalia sp. 19OD2882]|uniref:VOC family protein n=1 Tax=Schaalia sp. 19OD2882 TaxID=2794089 RepID=UPI001C1EDC94|nr:VOC family protein [Schaalia sp. 19OD2882]QWW20023.1 VOC family protein [Schaalia sp. 19OD2882]
MTTYPSMPQSDTTKIQVMPSFCIGDRIADALETYRALFTDSRVEGILQPDPAGAIVAADLTIHGSTLNLLDGGGSLRPTGALSLLTNFDPGVLPGADEYLRSVWQGLSDGGEVLMPLQAYPHSPLYGWVKDRFGVHWQLMLTDPAGEPRPFLTPSLMFDRLETATALRARADHAQVFAGVAPEMTGLGHAAPYPGQGSRAGVAGVGGEREVGAVGAEPGPDVRVMFSEALLGGTHVAYMDTGVELDMPLNMGSSMLVKAVGQEQVDHVWTMSADPDTEVCGWMQDGFGLSWQVAPNNIHELLQAPGAMARMQQMKKIDIAALAELA